MKRFTIGGIDKLKQLYGVTTAMVTPFDTKGEVDVQGIKELTAFLIDKGVHGLYPLGTTGEMLKLSVAERKKVAETVVTEADKRVNVFIHIGAMNPAETIALAQHAVEIGADGIGVVTPIFFGTTEVELIEYFTAVANSVPSTFPVYVYNIPQCSANDLPVSVVETVAARCPNIIGIKYSYPDFQRISEYLAVNDAHFSVVPGVDKWFLPALAMGCDGVVSGVSSVYPEPFVAVYDAYLERDMEKAQRYQRLAAKFGTALQGGANLSYFKEALTYRGMNVGDVRKPQLRITEQQREVLVRKLRALEEESQELW